MKAYVTACIEDYIAACQKTSEKMCIRDSPITEAMIFELFGMNPVAVDAYWKAHFGDAFDCGAAMKLHLDYMEAYVRENGCLLYTSRCV